MLDKNNIKDIYALTPMQEGMFFHSQIDKQTPVYFEQFSYTIEGALDMQIARMAILKIFERYDILRTVFIQKSGKRTVQVVLKEVTPEIYTEDISNLPGATNLVTKFKLHDRKRSFNLSKELAVRIALFKTGEQTYELIWSFHHILMDGWCTGILVAEFGELYDSFIAKRNPVLEDRMPYVNYIKWIEAADKKEAISYWGKYLSGFERVTSFPKTTKTENYQKQQHHFTLDAQTTKTLQEYAKKHQVTFNSVFQAAWSMLLNGYSNTGDVVFGSVVSGRPSTLKGVEQMVGLFINTIPVRVSFTAETPVIELWKNIQQAAVNSEPYHYCALTDIFDQTVAGNALFDHILVFENYPVAAQIEGFNEATDNSYTVTGFNAFEQTNYNLNVIFSLYEELHVTFDYNETVFEKTFMQQLSKQLVKLFKQIAIKPEIKAGELSILSQQETNRIKNLLNNTQCSFPELATIDGIFTDMVKQFPQKTAVVASGKKITYAELDAKANRVAAFLRSKAIGPDTIVGVLLDRSIDMVVSILGILKAGAAYLPLTSILPENRINYMMQDSGATLVITAGKYSSLFQDNVEVIPYNQIHKAENNKLVAPLHTPNNLAYIIYTSGTTGKPKGVMVSHKNVVRLLYNDALQFSFSEKDVWTLFHSINFDFSVWEIFGALLYGGKLIVVSEQQTKDPVLFAKLITEENVTVLNQTPTSFYNVMQPLLKNTKLLPDLRYVIFGGEALKVAKLKAWKTQFPEIKLINMFGITETTVHVTYKEIGLQEIEKGTSNIGKPIPTTYIYILDDAGRIMPQGVVGEMYVGGEGVASGYLNREQLTKEKFIADPYQENATLYRSGDLARILSNGELEYLGRKDHQVQLHGFRIELAEIQNQLLSIEEINDAIVLTTTNSQGDASIHAYYTVHASINKEAIRNYLTTVLPYYMVPSTFTKLDAFSLTINGKIDTKKLPKPGAQPTNTVNVLPENDMEKMLLQLWNQVLETPVSGTDQNFFAIGGDSIKAVRLAGAINGTMHLALDIASLYQHSTIKELAAILIAKAGYSDTHKLMAVEASFKELKEEVFQDLTLAEIETFEDVFPLSDIEYGMLFHSIKDEKYTATYHDQFAFELTLPNFNKELFEQAFNYLVEKHEILRTGYHLTNFKEPVRVVRKNCQVNIHFKSLQNLNREGQQKHIEAFIEADRKIPFTLTEAPLYRPAVFQLTENKIVFVWIFHHVILDGWSSASFLTELNNTYQRLKSGVPYKPVKLKSTYKDFVVREYLAKQNESLQNYWRSELENYNRFRPFSQKKKNSANNLNSITFSLSGEFTNRIKTLSVEKQIPLNHIMFYAYAFMVTSVSYKKSVVVGMVSNNRPSVKDGDKVLGCFLNTLPVNVSKPESKDWFAYLNTIHAQLTTVRKNGQLSLYEIAKTVGEPSNDQNPFFDTLFNFVDFHIYNNAVNLEDNNSHQDSLALEGFENTNTAFDFTVNATGEQLNIRTVFDNTYISEAEINMMYTYFKAALQGVCNSNLTQIDFSNLSTTYCPEAFTVQNTTVNFPEEETIVSLFNQSVIANENRVAIRMNDCVLTYEALARRVDILSAALTNRGVKPNTIVALLEDRSIEMVISILAILKAGGIYMPINVKQPKNRIDYILQDSNAGIIMVYGDHNHDITGTEVFDLNTYAWTDVPKETVAQVTPKNGAYIIYTSGTTGLPKGVLVDHKNVVRLLFNEANLFDFNKDDIWTLFHAYNFDFSVWEMYGALLKGGELIVIPEETTVSPQKFRNLLENYKVTVLNQTPSAFYALQDEDAIRESLLQVRYVIFGGEALAPERLQKWYQRNNNCKLVNMYGITETTVHVTYKLIGSAEIESKQSNIGVPIPTTGLQVCDANGNRLPVFAVGQLCVTGEGLSKGYLNRPGLTASKFVKTNEQREYLSGDFGRLLPSGEFEYLGRIDKQVQIRGFRIELGEIQHQILAHPEITDACVIAKENTSGDPSLVAYYVAKNTLESSELRTYLSDNLQGYMIPNFFVKLDKLPLTSNGKLNVKSLPDVTSYTEAKEVAPENDKEQQMLDIWKSVLKNDGIQVLDNYFNVGGDSIKAIRLLTRINKEYQCELSVADIYKHQTVRALYRRIVEVEKSEQKKTFQQFIEEFKQLHEEVLEVNPALADEEIEDIYPMSDIQQGMIYHSLKNPEKSVYHDQMVHEVNYQDFNIDIFRKAVTLIVKKHSILRTAFDVSNYKKSISIVYKNGSYQVPFTDLSTKTNEAQKAFIENEITQDRKEPFDYTLAPLWRLKVYKLNQNRVVIFFVCHHAILDGWSDASFNTELHNTYMKLVSGEKIEILPALKCTYKDYVAAQYADKENPEMSTFWANELEDFKRLEFFNNPNNKNNYGEVKVFRKDLGVTKLQQITNIANNREVSVKVLSFTAYLYMLNMMSYHNDLVAGYVSNKRPVKEDGDKVLGCFLNTTPFRFKVPDGISWAGLVKMVDKKGVEIKNYEGMTLFEIVRLLDDKSNGENPLFDSLFNFMDFHVYRDAVSLNKEGANHTNEGLGVEGKLSTNTAFDFSVNITSGSYIISISYDNSFISRQNVERLLTYFEQVLDTIEKHPNAQVNKTAILPVNENEYLNQLAQPATAYPVEKTIDAIFKETAANYPHKIAVTIEGHSVTYQYLNDASDKLAEKLILEGVQNDTVVALFTDRSIEMIVAMLAVLKAGGCYMPVDISQPADRIRFMLKDSNAKYALCYSSKLLDLPFGIRRIQITLKEQETGETTNTVLNPSHTPEGLAYIIYTSGTTGTPKGVMVTHKNVVRLFFNDDFQFDFSPEDIWSQYHNYNFDFSVWEIYGAILNGGKTLIIPEQAYKYLPEFYQILKREKVTILNQTPSAFYHLIEEENKLNASGELNHIRYVIFGGEALHPSKLKTWKEAHSNTKLVNMYGITETTVHVTYKEIGTKEMDGNRSNIGKPIPTLGVAILDNKGEILPTGVKGELYVTGAGISKGYINREALTKERFVFSKAFPKQKAYRTGDLVILEDDKELSYLGRIDNQVQVRGFRIELGEIESCLQQMPAIKQAAVIAKQNQGEIFISAFYAAEQETEPQQIRAYLRRFLPEYMLPNSFRFVDTLPVTANGKIDKKALQQLPDDAKKETVVTAKTDLEVQVAKIMSEVVGKPANNVSIYDNFFDIGGHSLKAMTLISKIRQQYQVQFSLAQLLENPTINGICQHLQNANKTSGFTIVPVAKKPFYKVSSAQRRLFILQQKNPELTGYNMPGLFHLKGNWSYKKAKATLQKIIDRNEILRTSVEMVEGNPVQRIHNNISFELQRSNYKATTLNWNEAAYQDLIEDLIKPFRLEAAPLFRVHWIDLENGDALLFIDIHHIISDGITLQLFENEFLAIYNGMELPLPKIQYKDFSEWEEKQFLTNQNEGVKNYWQQALEGADFHINLPYDYYSSGHTSNEGEMHTFMVSEKITGKLEALTQDLGGTLSMGLMAAFTILLQKVTRQDDIVTGLVTAQRNHPDLHKVMGVFINTLPIRINPEKHHTFKEFMTLAKTIMTASLDHQHLYSDALLDELISNGTVNFNNGHNVLFTMHNLDLDATEVTSDNADSLSIEPVNFTRNETISDLNLTARKVNNTLQIVFQYRTSLFSPETMKRIAGYFEKTLESVTENPNIQIQNIQLAEEFTAIETGFSGSEVGGFDF